MLCSDIMANNVSSSTIIEIVDTIKKIIFVKKLLQLALQLAAFITTLKIYIITIASNSCVNFMIEKLGTGRHSQKH